MILFLSVNKFDYKKDDQIFNFSEWFKENVIKLYYSKLESTIKYLSDKFDIDLTLSLMFMQPTKQP